MKGKPWEDREKLERRTGPILEEYLHNLDLMEAFTCISELYHMETIHWLVEVVFNTVVEKKEKDRVNAGKLFGYLLKNESLPRKEFVKGVNAVLEFAEDLQIDIPKFWEYFADMIGTILVEKTLDLNFLKESSTFLLESGLAGKYVSAVLTQMAKLDLGSAVELWQKSGLSFADFKVENRDKFVDENKLDFFEQPVKVDPPVEKSDKKKKIMQPVDPGFAVTDVRERQPKPVPLVTSLPPCMEEVQLLQLQADAVVPLRQQLGKDNQAKEPYDIPENSVTKSSWSHRLTAKVVCVKESPAVKKPAWLNKLEEMGKIKE